jgi:6,7-dimethyl-8-ribityllumazine synthase
VSDQASGIKDQGTDLAHFENIREIEPDVSGLGVRIGIVMSRFNEDVCEGLLDACRDELINCGVRPEDLMLVTVPGALEIPLALQKLAQSRNYDALIALGAVIRGETYHFEVVADGATRGLMDVQLETGIPIANAILTTDDEDQAYARMTEKGADAARVALEMANLLFQL